MKNKYLYIFLGHALSLFILELFLFQYLNAINFLDEKQADILSVLVMYMTTIAIALFPKYILKKKPKTKKEWIICAIKHLFFQWYPFYFFNKDYIFPYFRRQVQNFKKIIKYWAELPDE